MEENQATQVEHPPPMKESCNLHTTTVTQTAKSSIESSRWKKINSLLVASQAILGKEEFLKVDEELTDESIYTAFRLIYDRYKLKIPEDIGKVLVSFIAALGSLAAERVMVSREMSDVEVLAQKISTKVDNAMDKGLAKISNIIEMSLANQRVIQSTTKKLEKAADTIQKTTEDVNKNLATATDTLNKLTSTMSSYKEMLLSPPPPHNTTTARTRSNRSNYPKITRDLERKAKQVLVDIFNKDTTSQSQTS